MFAHAALVLLLGARRYTAVQHWADDRPNGPAVYPYAVPGDPHVHTSMCASNRRPLAHALAGRAGMPLSAAQEVVRANAASAFAYHFAREARGRRDCGVSDEYTCEDMDVFPCDLSLSLDPSGERQLVADHARAPLGPIKFAGGPSYAGAAYKNFRFTDVKTSAHRGVALPVHAHARACVQDAKANSARGEPLHQTSTPKRARATAAVPATVPAAGRGGGMRKRTKTRTTPPSEEPAHAPLASFGGGAAGRAAPAPYGGGAAGGGAAGRAAPAPYGGGAAGGGAAVLGDAGDGGAPERANTGTVSPFEELALGSVPGAHHGVGGAWCEDRSGGADAAVEAWPGDWPLLEVDDMVGAAGCDEGVEQDILLFQNGEF